MKRTRSLCLALTALLLLTLLSGCEKTPAEAPGMAVGIEVTDMMDRQLQLEQPAEKIVVLTAADCEILFAIGAGDQVVARGEYCNYPKEALALTEVASGSETNIEQIIAMEPDLVIMSSMDQPLEQVLALENSGIPVLQLAANTLDETYVAISLIGKVTGRDAEAEGLIASMKKDLAALVNEVDGESGNSVYFEVSPLEYGLWTAGKGTFMDELSSMLGLSNIFSDVNGWAKISQEQVIERNPDYIVTIFMAFDGAMDPVEEILARPGWAGIRAVSKRQVKTVNSDEIARPGPRLVNAARDLYEIFYGD